VAGIASELQAAAALMPTSAKGKPITHLRQRLRTPWPIPWPVNRKKPAQKRPNRPFRRSPLTPNWPA
jgi:hypothetical protein